MSRKDRREALDSAIASIGTSGRDSYRSVVPIVNQIETVFHNSAAELDRLRRSGHVLLELDPAELRVTRFGDRHAAALEGAGLDELVQDILRSGQLVPILVRAAVNGGGYDIIAGHRRVEACRRLGRRVLARQIAADDRELLVAMVRENEVREDISPFERALQIRAVIDTGVMSRQELMETLGFSKGHMSSLLKFAELPSEIPLALGDPRVLTIADGAQLARLLVSPEAREQLLTEAKALAASSDPPAERLRRLRAAIKIGRRSPGTLQPPSDRVIRSRTGQILVRLTKHEGRPILRLSPGIPATLLDKVFERLPELLRDCGLDVGMGAGADAS